MGERRVSGSGTLALPQQFRQLGDVRRDPPCLVPSKQSGIDVGEGLALAVSVGSGGFRKAQRGLRLA